jgi:hypothetical protein
MRSVCVVLDSVLLCQYPGFLHRSEQFDIQEFIPQPAVVDEVERSSYDSTNGFSQGAPGGM